MGCQGIMVVVQIISDNGRHVEGVRRLLLDRCKCVLSGPYHGYREVGVDDGVMAIFDERPEQ